MKLPGSARAVIDERKIIAYLLSLTHRDGRSKAIFFMRFGFTIDAWDVLAQNLLRHAADHEVAETEATAFGTSYAIEGPLVTPDGRSPQVRVIWFVNNGEDIPRLVTAYPLKGAHDD